MSSISQALRDFQSLESLAAQDSVLSALDARAKILVTLGFIVTVVSFDRYAVAALLPLALFPVILAALGNIPERVIGRSVLLAAPFAVMLGALNPFFDQQVVLQVAGYGITGGWLSFASILVRFVLTVSAGLILVASTGFAPLCAGLGRLGLPQVLTTQLLLLHRYAGVLANEAARMSQARELRANGRALPLAVYGPLLGHLLLRALQRAQRIHQAMLARGFDGQLHRSASLAWQRRDTLFLGACLLGFVLARQLDLAHLMGVLVLGIVR
ncbi:MAG: cobalt ECF transporter T component CbiQ [Rhodoferax sp.]|nr:cobalt ECF transporter T component CbiQ [Rhodoferax sp.]